MFAKVIMIVLVVAVTLIAGAYANGNEVKHASATLKNLDGKDVGFASFAEVGRGLVQINVSVNGLPPGTHGIHIHATGNCTPPFTAAGGHYNPLGRKHGLDNPGGAHAGDMPNLEVNPDGTGQLNITTDLVSLSPGPATLLDGDGSTLVIHAGPDDQVTDPAGNSGDRIACGVIVPG